MDKFLSRFSLFLLLPFFLTISAQAKDMVPVQGTGCQAMGESLSVAAARKAATDAAIKNAIEGVMVASQSLFVDVAGTEGKEEYQSIMRIVETTVAGRIANPRFSDFYERPAGTHCIDVAGQVDMEELRAQVDAIQGVDPLFEEQLRAKVEQYASARQPKDQAEANARKAELMEFALKKPVTQLAYGEMPANENKTPKQIKAEAEGKALALARRVALNRMVARLGGLPPDVLAIPLPQARNILDAGLKLANKGYMDQGGKPVAEPVWEGNGALAYVKATYAFQGSVGPFIGAGGIIPAKATAKGAMAGAPVVLMTLSVNGVIPPDTRKSFAKALERELGAVFKVFAGKKVEQAEAKAVENYEANECYEDDRCAADVANALGASYIAFPSVMKGGSGNFTVGLRILDVAKEEDIFDEERECPGCGDAEAAAEFGRLAKSAASGQ